MKPLYKTVSVLLMTVFIGAGCTSSFDDMNSNPNKPTAVTPGMLATRLILDMNATSAPSYWENEFLVKRIFWGEQMSNYQYNRIERGTLTPIASLTNGQKMVEAAGDVNTDAYNGLYYFMRGWHFFMATMNMGDVPYSQTLDIDNYRFPKYDAQKDVFKGILEDLEKADGYFANASTFTGDPYMSGDPVKWRKAVNVFRLKVLLNLQKRAEDTPELKVKETFAQIVSAGNIYKSNSDNLQIVYADTKSQQNPYHRENTRSIDVYAGTSMIINPLKEYKDHRLFYYFAPAQALVDETFLPEGETLLQPSDWEAYNGLEVAEPFSVGSKIIAEKMHNRPNDVYRLSYVGVPCIILGYADMNFMLAEAAERGWITGSAKDYYEEGIRASFDFVRTTVPSEYNNGVEITDEYINEYLLGEHVAYKTSGTQTDRLHQIWMQTYLAGYFHMNRDAFYNHRRTGYPAFPINPETNLNDKKDKIPVRWLYPSAELTGNRENLLDALRNQWGSEEEDVNSVMWVIK